MSKKSLKNKRKNGFTLIEMLISMAMIAILTGTILQVVKISEINRILFLNANEVVSVMRFAQSSALTAFFDEENANRVICGIGFVATSQTDYLLFYTYVNRASYQLNPNICNQTQYLTYNTNQKKILNQFKLKGGVLFNAGSYGNNNGVVFKVPYGEVYSNGSNNFNSKNFVIQKGSSSKTIIINSFGQISF